MYIGFEGSEMNAFFFFFWGSFIFIFLAWLAGV